MHCCNSSPKTAAYTTHLSLHQFRYQVLHALAFGTGIVVAVALKQIDNAPNAEARAQRDNKGLKYGSKRT